MMRSRKLSPSASYWFIRSQKPCIRCSLCSCVRIRGTHLAQNFAIFQRCHHRFQRTEAYIQLLTHFPRSNPPIHKDEQIKTLFISWCDSCSWPSRTWLVLHVAVAPAETRHPPPHCANIYCLVSVNVQQAAMNVIGCILAYYA